LTSENPEQKQAPMEGVVKTVTQSQNYYHFHVSSTKTTTANGGDSDSDKREFKLVKRDLYLENREKSMDLQERKDLLNLLNIESSPNSKSHDNDENHKLLSEAIIM